MHLYGDQKLPAWVFKLDIEPSFVFHNRLRFLPEIKLPPHVASLTQPPEDEVLSDSALRISRWWQWPLVMSTPERAYLELLDEPPQKETFHMAGITIGITMEGLVNLSPRRLQSLLENAKSIKVKRLFFFFTDRHQHSWLKRINRQKIDLGKGKRELVKGGKLDPQYQITVPKKLSHGV